MPRLLICDDSATARRILVASLPKDRQFDVVQASNGADAIAAYQQQRPDLMLLDLTMPEMTGYEVLEKIRGFDPTARIVIVSADVQEEARKRVMDAGALSYVAKPMNTQQMSALLKAYDV